MAIRWDSVLVRGLARELDRTLAGAQLRAVRMDARTREVVLFFRDRTLVWMLHPAHSGIRTLDAVAPQPEDLRLRARVRSVRALDDERVIVLELAGSRAGRGPWTLVVELMGNRLNALVTEGAGLTIRHVLRTREGQRTLRVGQPWTPPESTGRRWIDGGGDYQAWCELLLDVPPPDRRRALLGGVAWTSPINAEACLEDGPDRPLGAGYAQWRALATPLDEPGEAVILETDRGDQPYPLLLPGYEHRTAGSLLEAIGACSEGDAGDSGTSAALTIGPELLERLEDAIAHAERRAVRLTAEFDGREDPEVQRAFGDLILARYAEIPAGAGTVTLTDFDGAEVELDLDPALPPHGNASRYYDRATRSERAAERLPALIEEAGSEARAFAALLERARAGEVDADEVRRALPAAPARQRRGPQAPSLPYRTFRSSGGLEIRVGRGARHNDDLTFRHSAPNDVWLHARHTAGAHVILRWPNTGAPPARDLAEAATLAALNSKARTSSSVPVDWTLRKYVRKPRGSAPGSVVPDRVQTLFVEPDEAIEDRLETVAAG